MKFQKRKYWGHFVTENLPWHKLLELKTMIKSIYMPNPEEIQLLVICPPKLWKIVDKEVNKASNRLDLRMLLQDRRLPLKCFTRRVRLLKMRSKWMKNRSCQDLRSMKMMLKVVPVFQTLSRKLKNRSMARQMTESLSHVAKGKLEEVSLSEDKERPPNSRVKNEIRRKVRKMIALLSLRTRNLIAHPKRNLANPCGTKLTPIRLSLL